MNKEIKLEKIIGNTYVIKDHTNIGVYKVNEHDVYLIDSGFNLKHANLIMDVILENNFNVLGIINTHSHIDHIGGNKLFQDKFDAKIFVTDMEKGMVENTLIEPSCLVGSKPNSFVRKFWNADNSIVTSFNELPDIFEIIDLNGHSAGMVGVKTLDNVLFLGDALINPGKMKIGYIYDIEGYLNSIEKLKNLNATYYVPSHADVYDSIDELIQKNLESMKNLENLIISLCNSSILDDIIANVFKSMELEFNVFQYYLVGTTIKSYLSYLLDKCKVSIVIKDNKILYTA